MVPPQPQQAATPVAQTRLAEPTLGEPIQRVETPNRTGLPDNLKSGIENLSGYSMEDVRVHYNSAKPAQLQAHAYAQGTDIHVAPGQEKHLPHEAWHVVQQKQGRVKATRQLKGKVAINDDPGLEREADVMGSKAIQNKRAVSVLRESLPQHLGTTSAIQLTTWDSSKVSEALPLVKELTLEWIDGFVESELSITNSPSFDEKVHQAGVLSQEARNGESKMTSGLKINNLLGRVDLLLFRRTRSTIAESEADQELDQWYDFGKKDAIDFYRKEAELEHDIPEPNAPLPNVLWQIADQFIKPRLSEKNAEKAAVNASLSINAIPFSNIELAVKGEAYKGKVGAVTAGVPKKASKPDKRYEVSGTFSISGSINISALAGQKVGPEAGIKLLPSVSIKAGHNDGPYHVMDAIGLRIRSLMPERIPKTKLSVADWFWTGKERFKAFKDLSREQASEWREAAFSRSSKDGAGMFSDIEAKLGAEANVGFSMPKGLGAEARAAGFGAIARRWETKDGGGIDHKWVGAGGAEAGAQAGFSRLSLGLKVSIAGEHTGTGENESLSDNFGITIEGNLQTPGELMQLAMNIYAIVKGIYNKIKNKSEATQKKFSNQIIPGLERLAGEWQQYAVPGIERNSNLAVVFQVGVNEGDVVQRLKLTRQADTAVKLSTPIVSVQGSAGVQSILLELDLTERSIADRLKDFFGDRDQEREDLQPEHLTHESVSFASPYSRPPAVEEQQRTTSIRSPIGAPQSNGVPHHQVIYSAGPVEYPIVEDVRLRRRDKEVHWGPLSFGPGVLTRRGRRIKERLRHRKHSKDGS